MNARKWLMEYGVAIVMAVVFAAVLGQLSLFRETAIGKLHASDLVQFIGYGGALVIAWLGARQLTADPPDDWKWIMPYKSMILPVTTLLIVGVAYGVLLYICQPFLNKTAKGIYNWMFIVGIVGASAWIIFTWVQRCVPHVTAADSRRLRKQAA